MCGSIVKELVEGMFGGFGDMGLGRRELTQGGEHGGVGSAGVEKKSANDLLESPDFMGWETGGSVNGVSELDGGTILFLLCWVSAVLGLFG